MNTDVVYSFTFRFGCCCGTSADSILGLLPSSDLFSVLSIAGLVQNKGFSDLKN
jgi:hypothetical protein